MTSRFSSVLSVSNLRVTATAVILTWVASLGCTVSEKSLPKKYTFSGSKNPMITAVKSTESQISAPTSLRSSNHPDRDDSFSRKVETTVTFAKTEILGGRQFLYGSDLQYSSLYDEDMALHYQSLAMGHEIATFRVFGNELQLIADTAHYYESDVNHPGRLIHSFPILSEDATSLTVSITRGSAILATVAEGGEAAPVRSNWLRSLEYVQDGNYLLMESSIETGAGNVVEFMESVFPRDTLVPTNYEPIYNDPSVNPLASRFGFLSNGGVYVADGYGGKVMTAFASRFLPNAEKTIDWYVTRNAPADLLPAIQAGVEAWNRYYQEMWDTDGVRFAGYLPEGVKLGDPRYNVINWDQIAEAGAAYEMQATDPLTGIQSHSLIYLPAAWLNIGYNYWQKGQFSEAQGETHTSRMERLKTQMEKARFLGRSVKPHCFADLTQSLALKSEISPEAFAVELLKGVLFHEMGHALGLAHNFKGSLSFGPNDMGKRWNGDALPFSTSIMDYNQFQIERDAFDSIDSANGPLLEYDRQIISVLYHEGWDIEETDPVLPTCEDTVADYQTGAVDPLCIRYDAGQDPSKQVLETRNLITHKDSKLGRTVSLARSIELFREELDLGEATDLGTAAATVQERYMELMGAFHYYTNAGAQSLGNLLSLNAKAMLEHVDSEAAEFDRIEGGSAGLRRRVFAGIHWALALNEMPEEIQAEMNLLKVDVLQWLSTQGFFKSLPETQRVVIEGLFSEFIDGMHDALIGSSSAQSPISKMRLRAISALGRKATASFHLGTNSEDEVEDFELNVITSLSQSLFASVKATGEPVLRPITERLATARALKSYDGTEAGLVALLQAREKVAVELKKARTTQERDGLRALKKALN